MNAAPRSAPWAVYRSVDLTPPAPVTDDALIEVTLSWGDEVLSVAHLARGDRFEHTLEDGATMRVTRDAAVEVEAPEGASAWVLRDGVCEDRRATFALPVDARACVARGDLTLRVRRVDAAEPLPRARRVTGFAAVVTCALALATTGGVCAQSLDDSDDAIEPQREDPRPWIIAQIARFEDAPPPANGVEGVMVGRSPLVSRRYNHCCHEPAFDPQVVPLDEIGNVVGCGCFGFPGAAPGFEGWPLDHRATRRGRSVRLKTLWVTGPSSAPLVRHEVTRKLGELARCNVTPADGPPSVDRRVTLRFVIGSDGDVLAAAVTSSNDPYVAVAECMTHRARAWSFPSLQRGVSTVEASFSLR